MEGVLGVPGDVGGLAIGAELIEWAPRLCVCDSDLWEAATAALSGDRVFVKVIVTVKGSPAKYEDCDGATVTRTAVSGSL